MIMNSLTEYTSIFQSYLQEQVFNRKPDTLYAPFSYLLAMPAKRLRPTLLLVSNQLFQGNLSDALPAAMAIELFHNFTLIHDDIMDDADLRRGNQTIHTKYGESTAILSGDAMMVYAYNYLLQSKNSSASLPLFNEIALLVCEGQQLDMDFEQMNDVTLQDYMLMIQQKTAVLVAASLQIGAITAGASPEDQYHLYEFGKTIGISFQLLDDILDSFPEGNQFGKTIGGDIMQNKKTYLLLKTQELASQEQANKLQEALQLDDKTIKVEQVKSLMQQTGGLQATKQEAENYYLKALKHLGDLSVSAQAKKPLYLFAKQLLQRSR